MHLHTHGRMHAHTYTFIQTHTKPWTIARVSPPHLWHSSSFPYLQLLPASYCDPAAEEIADVGADQANAGVSGFGVQLSWLEHVATWPKAWLSSSAHDLSAPGLVLLLTFDAFLSELAGQALNFPFQSEWDLRSLFGWPIFMQLKKLKRGIKQQWA